MHSTHIPYEVKKSSWFPHFLCDPSGFSPRSQRLKALDRRVRKGRREGRRELSEYCVVK